MKIGILKETKVPMDRRVALPPIKCVELKSKFKDIEIIVQPSDIRAFADEEYATLGITLNKDLSDCDLLIGIKEVDYNNFIPNKKYLFFSHTTKKQEHNKKLLQKALEKNITLIDYEYLTDKNNIRLVAFGYWAGIVGAYNGLIALGKQTNLYNLKKANDCHDLQEMFVELEKIKIPPVKIVITGNGRVSHGALEIMERALIKEVLPNKFLTKKFDIPVFCQLSPKDYVARKDSKEFDLNNFFMHPTQYNSIFKPFTQKADMFIACHFWDNNSPNFITKEDILDSNFKISLIADISCDLDGPIASTLRTSTIKEPFYGYDKKTGKECSAFYKNAITVMAVDNLPSELPRDTSIYFADNLIKYVFNSFFDDKNQIIEKATITQDGKLTKHFKYLESFAKWK